MEEAYAFECAQYILDNEKEKQDFARNPSVYHVYYKAIYAIDGVVAAREALMMAEDYFYSKAQD